MKVTLIVLIALAASAALGKRSAAVRHWVLAMGMLFAGLTPSLSMVLPEWHQPFGGQPAVEAVQDAASPTVTTGVEFFIPSDPSGNRPARASVSLEQALRAAWAAGTTMSLLVLFVGLCRLAWLASRARRVTDPRWKELLGPVALLQSGHPALLVTWGFFRPKIVLPALAEEWSDDRMRIVLWHELSHIRRGDWFVQLLAEFLRAAYWFNPLVWIACRRLRQESEQACDDEVLGLGVVGVDYATELLGLARDLRQPRRTLFSGFPAPAMARPSSLGRRVSAMLNAQIDRRPITATARVATVVALLLVAIPIATAQSFATLSGTLVDPSGAPIAQARVILTSADKQSKHEVLTAPAGAFQFVGVLPGVYELSTQVDGFAAAKENVTLAPGQTLQRPLQVRMSSLSETITIAANPSDLSPDPVPANVIRATRPADAKPDACVAAVTGGNIRPPRKLVDIWPVYPAAARTAGAQGVVVLGATIGLDGFLKDIDVLRDGGNSDLALAAVTAVREWEYSQTLLNCSPVEVRVTVMANFTLRH
jgi:TonB family protein